MDDKRIRLLFKDDDILSETQKSDGLNRSWLLLKPQQHDTVSDVASHLLHAFQLRRSCPNGLLLSMSGFVLPPFESSQILKDNEVIRVRKRRAVLPIAGNNAAGGVQKLKAVEKQPVNNGVLLLANDEFGNEKGGSESDDSEEGGEEEGDMSKDMENPSCEKPNRINLKRKAPEKLRGSKKKKQRSGPSGSAENDDEKSLLEGGILKRKKLSSEEKKVDSNAGDDVENNKETVKSSKSRVPEPDMNGKDENQENGKEVEDGETSPKEKKKHPSRSARRKKRKRQWLKEMGKIQKQNATCESEGLRNWKEDQAKDKRKTVAGKFKGQLRQKWKKHQIDSDADEVDDQPKGLKWKKHQTYAVADEVDDQPKGLKWKKHQIDSDTDEVDDRPKGLLYWKQSPKKNSSFKGKKRQQINQNGDFPKHPNQNGDGLEQPNKKPADVNEQPDEIGGSVNEKSKQNCDAPKLLNQDSDDDENEVVPIVIKPGHIRFESVGKEQVVQQKPAPSEPFQWNGITSKKKGLQWGQENHAFTPRNDCKTPNKECSDIHSNKEEKRAVEVVEFDKLPPLTTTPKEGDLIAYCVLELSSTWTPEVSAHRVGKVSWYNAASNRIVLLPVPEYPIVFEKVGEDEEEAVQPDSSLYNEDGSLEISFSLLLDTRVFKKESPGPENEALSQSNEGSSGDVNTAKTVFPSSNGEQSLVPSTVNIWDELGEALSAKKDQLSKENGWGKTPKKVRPPPAKPENGWTKDDKMPRSGWGKNGQKVQTLEGGSSSSGKPWSYKGLRGGGLGSTMAILRSKVDT